MQAEQSISVDIIVDTLLQIGESVLEVSSAYVVGRTWSREQSRLGEEISKFEGRRFLDMRNDKVANQCRELIDKVLAGGGNQYLEYKTATDGKPVTYGIRVLSNHPQYDHVFVVVERVFKSEAVKLEEDKWKIALDAAGDGMWEVHLESGAMFFSEKWHELFGYQPSEITTVGEWTAKVHPDDLALATERTKQHFSNDRQFYELELRYLAKDGTYKWILSRGVLIDRTPEGKPIRFIGTHTDIHDRKVKEQKFYETAALLSKLVDNLPNGIMVTDHQGKVIFVNQIFCDLYDIKDPPSSLIGIEVQSGLTARKPLFKDPEKFYSVSMMHIFKKETVLNEELELKDGRIFSRDYIPLNLGGEGIGEIWKLRDVTAQKNADKRFEEQRQFYEQILNSIKADIVVFDSEGRYLFINPTAVKNTELREWMIGKTDMEYVRLRNKPIEIAERRYALVDQVKRERKQVEWEEKLVDDSGNVEYHLRYMFPVFDGEGALSLVISYGLNITERVLARQALQTSIDTFESAFNYSGTGMALISPEGRWLDVNDVLCNLLGYTKEELLQRTFQELTYPEDLEMDLILLKRLLRREVSNFTLDKRYVSKYDRIVVVSLTVSLVWNNDGTPKFFIAQVIDITKRKELENELKKKNFDLEATSVSLLNKISQLEELNYIVVHNLRGPAANIKMLAEGLAGVHKGDNSMFGNAFTQEEAVSMIHESSVSLMNNLDVMMQSAQIKLNQNIPYDECDVSFIITSIINQLHGVIYEKKAAIKQCLEIKYISYPKIYLESILYNLISNALKYSRADVAPEISISSTKVGNRMQLRVKDNGLGINMEKYKDRIFKLNQVFHSGYDSKGIGLYITKTQVESLGGTIEVKSELNVGSEFTVTL